MRINLLLATCLFPPLQVQILTALRKSLVLDRPKDIDDCITWAKNLFQEYFYDTIAQLLHSFPPDHVSRPLPLTHPPHNYRPLPDTPSIHLPTSPIQPLPPDYVGTSHNHTLSLY